MKKLYISLGVGCIILFCFYTPDILLFFRMRDMEKYVQTMAQNSVYQHIRSALADTIIRWHSERVAGTYIISYCPWKIDETVLFNPDTTKALLFFIILNTGPKDRTHLIIKPVFAKRMDSYSWRYYLRVVPTIGVIPDSTIRGTTANFAALQKIGRISVIEGGYYHTLTWIVDKNYINNWENMGDLEDQQRLFIEEKY